MFYTITKYNLTNINFDDIILNVQNIALFGISIYSLYCCTNYYVTTGQSAPILDTSFSISTSTIIVNDTSNFIKPFDNLLFVIKIYAMIDIFFVRTIDTKLHHLFMLGIIFYNWYNSVDEINRFIFAYSLLKTEISSIFLVLKYWIPKKTYAYSINAVLFYLSFFKFRVVDMYNEVITCNNGFDIIINKYTPNKPFVSGILYVSIYGLYVLNVYWFLIMTKIFYKQVCKNTSINTDKMCHYICAYIHCVNIPLAAYIYSYNKQEQNAFDMGGIVILSVGSYMYHYDIYERIHTKQIDEYVVPDNINHVYFLNDNISIHTRSFLTVFTNYYKKPYFYEVITFCGIFQLAGIYSGCINVIELLSKKTYVKSNFLKIHYIFTFLSIGIDILAIYLNTKSQQIAIPSLLVNLIIVLLFIVEPFYKLNHVAFHCMLIAQNYYLCLTNSSA